MHRSCVQADTLGSSALAALCQAQAAELHGRCGNANAARMALDSAAIAVEGVIADPFLALLGSGSWSSCNLLLKYAVMKTDAPIAVRYPCILHLCCAGLGIGCCADAAAFLKGCTAFAHACCTRWDGKHAAALEDCAAGLADLNRHGTSSNSGCSQAGAWHAAELGLRLQLQQAKCQAALVRTHAAKCPHGVTAA